MDEATKEMLEQIVREMPDDLQQRIARCLTPAQRLEGLSLEQRLEGLSLEQRLEGLTLEQRLEGLTLKERLERLKPEVLEALVRSLPPELGNRVRGERH